MMKTKIIRIYSCKIETIFPESMRKKKVKSQNIKIRDFKENLRIKNLKVKQKMKSIRGQFEGGWGINL